MTMMIDAGDEGANGGSRNDMDALDQTNPLKIKLVDRQIEPRPPPQRQPHQNVTYALIASGLGRCS